MEMFQIGSQTGYEFRSKSALFLGGPSSRLPNVSIRSDNARPVNVCLFKTEHAYTLAADSDVVVELRSPVLGASFDRSTKIVGRCAKSEFRSGS